MEDGQSLRLLAGLTGNALSDSEPAILQQTPTRFGRINLHLTPSFGGKRWRLEFSRGSGAAPSQIELPATVARDSTFFKLEGAKFERRGNAVLVDGGAKSFAAEWRI